MIVEIVGIANIDFTNDKNEKIKGTNFYYMEPVPRGVGQRTNKFFVPDQIKPVGSYTSIGKYDLQRDVKGKIVSCELVK